MALPRKTERPAASARPQKKDLLLLRSDLVTDRVFGAEVARAARLELKTCADFDELAQALSSDRVRAALVAVGTPEELRQLEAQISSRLGLLSRHAEPGRFHFLLPRGRHAGGFLLSSPLLGMILHRGAGRRALPGPLYGQVLAALDFPADAPGPPHSLSALVLESALIERSFTASSPEEDFSVLRELHACFQEFGFGRRLCSPALTAAEEILANAIHVSRLSRPEGLAPLPVEISWRRDAVLGVLSIRDEVGSLDRLHALDRIYQQTLKRDAGAGLRLAQAGAPGLVIRCIPGKETQALLLYPRVRTLHELRAQGQFTLLLSHQEDFTCGT